LYLFLNFRLSATGAGGRCFAVKATHQKNCPIDDHTPVRGKSFQELFASPPKFVAWSELGGLVQLDQRRMCIEMIQGVIIGMVENAVEFAPDNDPPTQDEVLCWIWFLRRDLASEISPKASPPLRELMDSHKNGTMERWWEQLKK
jgi:hypothetical protein